MVTYRLRDALPIAVVRRLKDEQRDAHLRHGVEAYLDAGHGSCVLRRDDVAAVVVANWQRFDAALYALLAWVVMPNHVHVLLKIAPDASLGRIAHAWKSYTAKAIARLANTAPPVWQPDYWDRLMRDERHLAAAVEYIHANPVKAGLVSQASNWRWSSAREHEERAGRPRSQG